jgi:hypothetical protein
MKHLWFACDAIMISIGMLPQDAAAQSSIISSVCIKPCLTPNFASQGHHEAPPYQNDTMRSAYHVRELEVYRLLQLQRPVDIALSHDWPRGIAHHGDMAQLFRAKTFLRREVRPCTPVCMTFGRRPAL